jgi:hypothetical protein
MATTTPNFGWPVPTSTDYVKDGAVAIEALGDAIDATVFGLNPGLVYITSSTFTTQSQVTFNSCFSATYNNYLVLFEGLVSTSIDIRLRMAASGTPASASNYIFSATQVTAGGGPSRVGSTSANYAYLGTVSTTRSRFTLNITEPFLTQPTTYNYQTTGMAAADVWTEAGGGGHTLTTSYNGFQVFLNSGTMSGTIRVYGYKNS